MPGARELSNLDGTLIIDALHELLDFRSRVARLADQDVVHGEWICEFKARYALTLVRQRPVAGRKKNWRGSDKGGMSGCGAKFLRSQADDCPLVQLYLWPLEIHSRNTFLNFRRKISLRVSDTTGSCSLILHVSFLSVIILSRYA